MRFKENVKSVWLTLNRNCNFRCPWCYANGTKYSNKDVMDLVKLKEIINLLESLKIKKVTLIGGEPTLYKDLFEIIKLLSEKGISVGLITNGFLLNSEEYVKKLKKSGLKSINISIKGVGNKQYFSVAGLECFDHIINAIKIVMREEINVTVSYVLNENNMDSVLKLVKILNENNIKNLRLSFCYPEVIGNEDYYHNNPLVLIDKFCQIYEKLDEIFPKFILHQSLPLCIWDRAVLEKMKKKKQIKTVCQIHSKGGLIFDTDFNLLPCNALYDISIGKYGVDFNDGEEFKKYFYSYKIESVYRKILKAPSKKCSDCVDFSDCGGGCILNWQVYNLDQLLKERGCDNG